MASESKYEDVSQKVTKNAPLATWIEERLPVFSFITHSLRDYPTPKNLSYAWNFGSLLGVMLVIMILTGLTLSMFYVPNTEQAFESVERIMREVNYGWLLRYLHMNGASLFFILVYIHMARGLYYGSYKSPRELLWILGVVIYVLMMATAFLGYVLPWGQMSFWGAKVITSLFSAIPLVGEDIVQWLWGGFSVGNPTLNKFYSLHFLLPFVIVGVTMLHLIALHRFGSGNPLGIDRKRPEDSIPFHPYYTIKDLFGLAVFFIIYLSVVFFNPNFFGEPDNYIPANPMVTPVHIVPEWYFLPFYAILRSIPNKLLGVLALFSSIAILFALPWLDWHPVRSARFRPYYRFCFWLFIVDCFVLGWVGGNPPEGYFILIGQLATGYYFFHFLVILPYLSRIEPILPLPMSISNPILMKGNPIAKSKGIAE
jgi:ubiquinol-cytochrome c reductase cytochrome b subunit